MRKFCPGFTLIELLVTITIITLVFTIGLAQYNRFNRRQILIKAKDQLISDLRLTQSKALSAEKPIGCEATLLSGHKLEFISNANYQITAVCGSEIVVKSGLSLPEGITKQSGPDEVLFKILSQGTDISGTASITLLGFGETQDISINSAGEIK
jgi:prepilin-type N-terminal cleavage/methylation domain-containing protein